MLGGSCSRSSPFAFAPLIAPLAADLPYIAASIETYARPDSVTVNLVPARPLAVARALTVWAKREDGLTAPDLAALVSAALVKMIASYPIGGIAKPPSLQGHLYADNISGTARSAHPSIFDIDGAGVDVAMGVADVADVATLAATVDVRIIEVST